MAEVASAYVSLLPSGRGFGRQVESEIGGEVDQAGVSLGRRLGAGLGKAAAAAVATLGGVALAAGTVGVRTAAQLEQAEIGFTTMLGSGEKAQAFLADLAGFAARTPFELPELQTAASSLVSVGVSADKVIPIMTSLGNATSGMGTGSEGIKRATVALQQMNAAGRITGEDLNQLRDAGIPVYDLLAAATGKSVEQVAALAQAGKLGKTELDQLMGALESGAGLERFTGLMETQSQSLVGMWSTLKDTFSMGMADAVQPLIPLIKDGLGGAAAFVTAQMPALKDGLAGVVTGVESFVAGLQMQGPVDGFTGSLNTAGLGLRALVEAFRSPDVTSDGFVGVMERIGSGARGMYDAIQSLIAGGGTSELGAQLGTVGESAKTLVPAVQAFIAQMPSLTDVVTVGATVLAFLADNADLLVKYMPVLVGALIAYKVAQLASNVAVAASPVIRLLEVGAMRAQAAAMRELVAAQRLSTASTTADTAAQTVGLGARIRGAAATVAHSVATAASATAARLAAAGQWVLNAALSANPIGIVIAAIVALVAGLVWFFTQTEVGQRIVTAAWAGIKAAIAGVGEWITKTVPAWWQSVLASTRSVWSSVTSKFTEVRSRVSAAVQAVLNVVRTVFSYSPLGLVTSNFGAIVDFFRSVPGRITGALGDLGSLLVNAGKNILDGFLSGLRNGFEAVKDFVGGIGSWIAENKGPKAYDLALLRPAGGWIMTGLRRGIEDEMGALRGTLGDVTRTIETGANLGAVGVGADGGNALPAAGVTVSGNTFQGLTADEVAQALHRESRRLAAVTGMRRVASGV